MIINEKEIDAKNRQELINEFKAYEITAIYGIGELPVSYIYPKGFTMDGDAINFLKGIKIDEWIKYL